MPENRSKLARERAGLSVGQAARLVDIEREFLLLVEERDSHFADLDHEEVEKMADVYGVNVPWLRGEVPRRDYEAMKDARGWDDITDHDRDVIAEFAAAMPRGKAKRP